MNRFTRWWLNLNESLWFLPTVIVLSFLGLAYGLVYLDRNISHGWEKQFPWLFGAGAEGARAMLAAIAGSMITVAALIFTLTLTTLAQVSNQYSPRVLWTFVRDRANQMVLGSFLSIFGYCLVVLRAIREDEEQFVPSVAIAVGLVLTLLSIGVLIFFIHHLSISIEASHIVYRVMTDTKEAMQVMFPQQMGDDAAEDESADLYQKLDALAWQPVLTKQAGYIQSVDDEALLEYARQYGCVVRMELAPGSFVAESAPLVSVANESGQPCDPGTARRLLKAYVIGKQRTIEQDVGFGLRLIVDIALKALSPGVNDTSTAVICIDHLGSLLALLGDRDFGNPWRSDEHADRVLVLTRRPAYRDYVTTALDQIRISGSANLSVLMRLLYSLETATARTPAAPRQAVLWQQCQLIGETAERKLETDYERAQIRQRLAEVRRRFQLPTA